MGGRKRAALAIAWLLLALLLMGGCAGGVALATTGLPGGGALPALAAEFVEPMQNYDDPDGPLYTGQYAIEPAAPPDALVVVTYNLRYGEAIDEALDAFRTVAPLPEADIILMQEMDAPGVDRLARELGYNYVYYPASVAEDGDDFGNAILARWPIADPVKLILPGLHPISGQQRIATRAVVDVGGAPVLAYAVHTEIATTLPWMRDAQIDALIADIPADAARVVIGGDFNTVTAQGTAALVHRFVRAGLNHDSARLGPTFTRFGLRPSATDHLFSRGLERLDAGVLRVVVASDHYPVWVRYASGPFATSRVAPR